MNFVQLPNNIVYAWIPRIASTSIARALLDAFYPERLAIPVSLPPDRLEPTWQQLLPRAHDLQGQRIVGLIRNPIERFRSACARTGKTVNEGLSTNDVHFAKVSELTRNNIVEWYRFPDQLAEFCTAVGLPSIPTLNDSDPDNKPTLTASDQALMEEHYADDIILYNAAGVELTPTVTPNPVPQSVTPLQMRRALTTAGLRDSVESAVSSADDGTKDAWEYATEIRRDNALLATLASGLGKTSVQIDDLFRLALTY